MYFELELIVCSNDIEKKIFHLSSGLRIKDIKFKGTYNIKGNYNIRCVLPQFKT